MLSPKQLFFNRKECDGLNRCTCLDWPRGQRGLNLILVYGSRLDSILANYSDLVWSGVVWWTQLWAAKDGSRACPEYVRKQTHPLSKTPVSGNYKTKSDLGLDFHTLNELKTPLQQAVPCHVQLQEQAGTNPLLGARGLEPRAHTTWRGQQLFLFFIVFPWALLCT